LAFYLDFIRSGLGRQNIHALLGFADTLKFDRTVNEREQRIVTALADVVAGMDARAALAHDDAAGLHELPVKTFDAQVLRVAIAAIVSAAAAFFMCHFISP
jgi:hypothetical protein